MGSPPTTAELQQRIDEALRGPRAAVGGFSPYDDGSWRPHLGALQAAADAGGVAAALDAFDALRARGDSPALRHALVVWLASSADARRLGLRAPGPRGSRQEPPPP